MATNPPAAHKEVHHAVAGHKEEHPAAGHHAVAGHKEDHKEAAHGVAHKEGACKTSACKASTEKCETKAADVKPADKPADVKPAEGKPAEEAAKKWFCIKIFKTISLFIIRICVFYVCCFMDE